MLLPRIIPCLLLSKNDLVKTINFRNPNYIGDPINAVKIFNEKKADELFLLDIDATVKKYEPNYQLIKKIARESRMPICYGGGIKNLYQAKKLYSIAIKKKLVIMEAFMYKYHAQFSALRNFKFNTANVNGKTIVNQIPA